MRRILKTLLLLIFAVVGAAGLAFAPLPFPPAPELKSGDLIFRSNLRAHGIGIMAGTASLYSHTGIVRLRSGKPEVLDSAGAVRYWQLETWIGQGLGGRYAVYRPKKLAPGDADRLFAEGERYLGVKYDKYFLFDDDALYCSELPWKMFKAIGRPLGKVQRVRELPVDNPFTQALIRDRWAAHPLCLEEARTFTQCYERIMDQELVTPASFAGDAGVEKIFSNYLGGLL